MVKQDVVELGQELLRDLINVVNIKRWCNIT